MESVGYRSIGRAGGTTTEQQQKSVYWVDVGTQRRKSMCVSVHVCICMYV